MSEGPFFPWHINLILISSGDRGGMNGMNNMSIELLTFDKISPQRCMHQQHFRVLLHLQARVPYTLSVRVASLLTRWHHFGRDSKEKNSLDILVQPEDESCTPTQNRPALSRSRGDLNVIRRGCSATT